MENKVLTIDMNGENSIRRLTPEEIEIMSSSPSISNDDIRSMREQAYKKRSDSLYIAWQKYMAMGDERAEQAKINWLAEVHRIENELPYL